MMPLQSVPFGHSPSSGTANNADSAGTKAPKAGPPEAPKIRMEIRFIRPDRTVSSRMIIESGKPNVIIQGDDEDETD